MQSTQNYEYILEIKMYKMFNKNRESYQQEFLYSILFVKLH